MNEDSVAYPKPVNEVLNF